MKNKIPKINKPIDECMAVYKAIAAYVSSHEGKVIIGAGIQLQEWPGQEPGHFVIGVRCFGKKPNFRNPS